MVRKYAVANMAEILDNVRPFTVGFDRVFDNLNNVSEIANNYPPYNIIKNEDDDFTIEIACAGFRKEEFNIHVVPEGNKLVVQGVQDRGEDKKEYYHKGIGARNFTRTFALSEDVKVTGSEFVDGMLNIFLTREIPEEKKPIEIEVN
jgi:molecular chaperone IbpA